MLKHLFPPKGYSRKTRDEKFEELIRKHLYKDSENDSINKFGFTHPNHGSIWIWEDTGECDVWYKDGDGTVLQASWDGPCFGIFKNYVVSIEGARQEYNSRIQNQRKKIKSKIDAIKTPQSSPTIARTEE